MHNRALLLLRLVHTSQWRFCSNRR